MGGSQVNTGSIMTGDRGHVSESFAGHLSRLGIGSLFILRTHLNNFSPWVAFSRCGDSNERFGPDDGDPFSEESAEDSGCHTDFNRERISAARPSRFIIDDAPNAGPAVFVAQKAITRKRNGL